MLLSRREAFPNAVLEYMAACLPVLASQTVSISEMVIRDTTAFVLEDPTPVEVAAQLRLLYHDSALRGRMARAARKHLEQSPSVVEGATPTVQSLIQRVGCR
jgi:glycosyltransferase involved in cell wall biosynthesis